MQRKTRRTLNFTKTTIEKLSSPATGREYHWDEKVNGLAVCITAAGSKSFYVVRRTGPSISYVRIGGWPEWSVERARDEAGRIAVTLSDGINPNEQKRQKRQAPTLGEAFTEYLTLPTRTKSKRPRSPKTTKEYELQFAAYLENWRNRRLSEIKRADVEALHNHMGQANGQYVANRVLALLKAIYNAAIDADHTGVNPAARIRKFEEQSRERFLQADELPKFWAALEAEPSDKVRDFIKLALFTGQRRGNVLSMRWADVNLERGIWTIPQTKTGKHSAPLTAEALDVLRRRHAVNGNSQYVFPAHHGNGHLQDPMRAWRDILKRAGIDDLRIHDLRRSLGSWQAKTGASLPIIGKTLGHSQAQTTMIYGRLDSDPVLSAMQTATAAIMAAAQPKEAKARKGRGVKNG